MHESDVKVLHLVAGDPDNGAARGAYSLHRGLLANAVHSRMLLDSGADVPDETVTTTGKGEVGRVSRFARLVMDRVPTLLYPKRRRAIFSTGFSGYDFTKTAAYADATILHLHWINEGFVSIRRLRNVNKPIVWTFRDMWPMTGGCHYAMDCRNYLTRCGKCPQLNSAAENDLSRFVFALKEKNFPKSIKIVGISRWIAECAKESALFRNFEIHTISNSIDTSAFSPVPKDIARSKLGLKSDKKIVLIGANIVTEFYKGFPKFLDALQYLNVEKYHLCFFGKMDPNALPPLKFSSTQFGTLHDTGSLSLAYSAADVLVAPSLMEAFGKTLAEAMACETPVVCFDATGPRDIVDHLVNGYRSRPFEAEDLARGIAWVCGHPNYAALARSARAKAVECFDNQVVARQYRELYLTC